MILEFQDLEDHSNPANGTAVGTITDLHTLFANSSDRRPFFFTLRNADIELTIGFGPEAGCIQHGDANGAPPYRMALNPQGEEGFVEFLVGGTATPVSKRYCLQIDFILELAAHFIESGQRSTLVEWEEI
jgi:hypothetical protein